MMVQLMLFVISQNLHAAELYECPGHLKPLKSALSPFRCRHYQQ